METSIKKLQEEILELHNQKENTISERHFDKCIESIYIKQRALSLLGGADPLR